MRALLALALAAAGCSAPVALPVTPEPSPMDRTVVVTTSCALPNGASVGRGNGVVAGPHEVLTAAHVVGRHPESWCPHPIVLVSVGGENLQPDALGADPDRDLSRLHFPTDLGFPVVAEVPAGQGAACAVLRFPDPGVACGFVGPDADPSPGTDLELDFGVIAGNSGAGIWRDGALIGLVTARDTRDPDHGWGTSVVR